MGILKDGFSAYSSPVMLISKKLIKDKRVVTDFRHLNVRITKTVFSSPISQGYIFSVREFQMQDIVSIRPKRRLSLTKTVRKLKKIL